MNKAVKYITYWDGCDEIETNAKLNTLTGEIIEIESVEVGNEYEICEGEFIQYEDGSMEQVITADDGRHFIVSKSINKTIEIQDTKYTVLAGIKEEDICKVCGITY